MRDYNRDLGFPGAVLVLLFFLPAFVLVVRRKWRIAAARKAEVKRLLLLAAEEEARAEIESALVYRSEASIDSLPVGGADGAVRQCAVCYSPTTTRCSRCKAVRYCSGKCQIIHWRQGHKDECRPVVDNQHDASGTHPVSNTPSAEDSKFSDYIVDDLDPKCAERHLEEHASSDSALFSVIFDTKDDVEVGNRVDMSGAKCILDPFATSSSNCSSSASCSEKLDAAPISLTTNSINVDDHHNVAVKSSSSIGISCGDLSDSKLREEVGSPKLVPNSLPLFSFSMSDNAIPSRTVANEMHTDGATSSKGVDVPSPKDTLPHYFDTKASVFSGRTNGEFPAKPRESKSPPNVVTVIGTDSSGGNLLLRRTVLTGAPPLGVQLSTTVDSASNDRHVQQSGAQRDVQPLKPSKSSKTYKMLPLYDLYIELYNEKVELQPFGLINCGNSCYANAVLQCLASTRPLTAYLLRGHHSKTCPKKGWCFTCEFESLLMKAKQGKAPVSPIGILSQIHNIGYNLGHGKEEDAHEFLRYAIDAMQPAHLNEVRQDSIGPSSDDTTLIGLIFGGYLRSKIRCMRCQGTSERCERIMDLTVEIHGDIRTLEEALSRFTATEILDGENKYKCNRCRSYEKAKKKLSVLEAPNVLTIALKRFQSGKFGKLNKEVRFPQILNMSKYMSSGSLDVSPVYCLFAVIVHLDKMNAAFSGHYVCYLKNTHGKWYRIDDSIVEPVELDWVLLEEAYMLLYARCSPRAPRLIRNVIPSGPRNLKSSRCRESVPFRRNRNRDAPPSRYNESYFPPYDGVHEFDSSSDNSSLLSYSDECSSSTRDSASTDELSDFFFGESVYSYSPLSSRYSSDASSVGCNSSSDLTYDGVPGIELQHHQEEREVFLQGKESYPLLPSDATKQCRKLTEQFSSRETDKVRSGLFMRRTRDLPSQT